MIVQYVDIDSIDICCVCVSRPEQVIQCLIKQIDNLKIKLVEVIRVLIYMS